MRRSLWVAGFQGVRRLCAADGRLAVGSDRTAYRCTHAEASWPCHSHLFHVRQHLFVQNRLDSSSSDGKNIIERLTESIKEEIRKDKALKDNLEKLRKERGRLEQSEAMQKARQKYQLVEQETVKRSEYLKKALDELVNQTSLMIEEAKKSELGRKALESTRETVQSLEKYAQAVGDTAVYKTVSSSVKTVTAELDDFALSGARMYAKPDVLRMRSDFSPAGMERSFEPNTEETTIQLHKEARWYQSFRSWADSSSTVNKVLDWKLKYEESDNPVVRVARFFTDKVSEVLSSKTEVSEVLTEIAKVDPEFDREEFLKFCETEIIPNILEAIAQGNVEVLKDWCHEIAFRQISAPMEEQKKLGYVFDSRILDISRLELTAGKMMEQGPVLILAFQSHQLEAVRNMSGKVIEGSLDKPVKVIHVWVLCRDMEELNPRAAWKLLEMHQSPQELVV